MDFVGHGTVLEYYKKINHYIYSVIHTLNYCKNVKPEFDSRHEIKNISRLSTIGYGLFEENEEKLLFQVLDNKNQCTSVYVDGEIKEASEDLNLTRTWFPASNFANERYDCGIIWSMGKTLDDCCPEDLKPYWLALNKKASAFLNSFQKSKINLQDICFYDLMPDWFLLEFFEVKNQITEHVFKEEKKT